MVDLKPRRTTVAVPAGPMGARLVSLLLATSSVSCPQVEGAADSEPLPMEMECRWYHLTEDDIDEIHDTPTATVTDLWELVWNLLPVMAPGASPSHQGAFPSFDVDIICRATGLPPALEDLRLVVRSVRAYSPALSQSPYRPWNTGGVAYLETDGGAYQFMPIRIPLLEWIQVVSCGSPWWDELETHGLSGRFHAWIQSEDGSFQGPGVDIGILACPEGQSSCEALLPADAIPRSQSPLGCPGDDISGEP